jgi:glucose-1-phosphate thymidylyltransferase
VKALKGLVAADADDGGSPSGWAELAPIANRPLIAHAIDSVSRAGVREIAVMADAAAAERLRRVLGDESASGAGVSYPELATPADGLDRILAAAELWDDAPLLLHPARTLAEQPLRDAVARFALEEVDALLVACTGTHRPGEAVPLEERRLARLMAQHGAAPDATRDSGLRLVGPRFLAVARECAANGHSRDMSALMEALVADGGRVAVSSTNDCWSYDGSLDSALEGNRRVLERLAPHFDPDPGSGVRVQGRARVEPTAKVESTTIRGPVVIGAGARIRDAYIGPYTSIGDDVQICGVEVENSIVLPRARIEYVGRRIEASIVGADAHIRRDFSLPRALRLWVGDHSEVCLV